MNENTGNDITGPLGARSDRDWLSDFRRQCERNLQRSLAERMRYGFCYVYKPVLDDAEWRSFDSTAQYRQWCRENLPVYLGFGEPDTLQKRALDESTYELPLLEASREVYEQYKKRSEEE